MDAWGFAKAHCASMYLHAHEIHACIGTHGLIARGVVKEEKPDNLGSMTYICFNEGMTIQSGCFVKWPHRPRNQEWFNG